MKYALIHAASGAVLQWQDHSQFGFAEPSEGLRLEQLPDDFEFPSEPMWFVGNAFTSTAPYEPPPTAPPLTAEDIKAQRDERLKLAAIRIAPLQDAVDLGEATEDDEAQLTLWKKYRVALNRIETQAGFPANVVWPEAPQ